MLILEEDLHKTFDRVKTIILFTISSILIILKAYKLTKIYILYHEYLEVKYFSNILGSEVFKNLIEASKYFDYVILEHSSNFIIITLILISLSDDYLFVVRHRVTKFNEINQTIRELNVTDANNVKYIYNDFIKPSGLYYGYDYYAYKYFRNYEYYSYDKYDK